MKVTKTDIEGVVILTPRIFIDERGYFFESWSRHEFEEKIGKIDFCQDNESMSTYGVIRGLHFQNPPYAQSKLVRCIKGRVLDVAVDIRKGSPTYGKHVAVELTEDNHRQLFIPKGSRLLGSERNRIVPIQMRQFLPSGGGRRHLTGRRNIGN